MNILNPLANKPSDRQFWFYFSLIIAIFYGIPVLQAAFHSPYVVQDDARQHVFWMRRFLDPDLFPNDLIADYFQSVAPAGYTIFYQLFAYLGIDPLLLSKLLPVPLGIIAALFGYQLTLQLLPIPFAGFLSSLLINQIIWSHDDVASASPRAFLPPLFLAFLYFLNQRSPLLTCGAIALEGLFYPQYVLIFAGITLLHPVHWRKGQLSLSRDPQDYTLFVSGLLTALISLLPYALTPDQYGAAITATEAKQFADFSVGGRSAFFMDNPWMFWLSGNRSGLFPTLIPPLILVGIGLPVLLKWRDRFPLTRDIQPSLDLLPKIVIVALFWFGLAHLMLFQLHLPSRYSAYSLRFVLAIAAAITFTLLFDTVIRNLRDRTKGFATRITTLLLTAIIGSLLLGYPSYAKEYLNIDYFEGKTPLIYTYLKQQPKDTIVASLLRDADFIPTLTERSLFVGREYAVPYHKGYGAEFRARSLDLIRAQYSRDPQELIQFIRKYEINFWLLDATSFQPDALEKNWTRQYPEAIQTAKANLQQGNVVLERLRDRCAALVEKETQLVSSQCLKSQL